LQPRAGAAFRMRSRIPFSIAATAGEHRGDCLRRVCSRFVRATVTHLNVSPPDTAVGVKLFGLAPGGYEVGDGFEPQQYAAPETETPQL
jgi:hypothetical protein